MALEPLFPRCAGTRPQRGRWAQPVAAGRAAAGGEGNGGCLQGAAARCTNAARRSTCVHTQPALHVHKLPLGTQRGIYQRSRLCPWLVAAGFGTGICPSCSQVIRGGRFALHFSILPGLALTPAQEAARWAPGQRGSGSSNQAIPIHLPPLFIPAAQPVLAPQPCQDQRWGCSALSHAEASSSQHTVWRHTKARVEPRRPRAAPVTQRGREGCREPRRLFAPLREPGRGAPSRVSWRGGAAAGSLAIKGRVLEAWQAAPMPR